ncbi:MAG: hypothetical protein JXR76_19050 [Deltaproteobacteria bacterium]|nr:hypothetical protein [Deltaproteobacteria bacterium]
MTPKSSKAMQRHRHTIGLSFVLSVIGCIFAILLVISNVHWVPVYIPNLPWKSDAVLFAFETPFMVALGAAFLLGCTVTFVIWRTVYRQSQKKEGTLRQQVSTLEKTLEKTQRLISSTQPDAESSNESKEQE